MAPITVEAGEQYGYQPEKVIFKNGYAGTTHSEGVFKPLNITESDRSKKPTWNRCE
jgi:hypothetical protein